MSTARFSFHGDLAMFLPRHLRGGAFRHAAARAATLKNAIESLGVPHTEVGALTVNGSPATLQRILREDDDVEVYPWKSSSDPDLRFVADAHLGGLARFLRMLGFDTLFEQGFADAEIRRLAHDDGRIVLTRDRELRAAAAASGCTGPGRTTSACAKRSDERALGRSAARGPVQPGARPRQRSELVAEHAFELRLHELALQRHQICKLLVLQAFYLKRRLPELERALQPGPVEIDELRLPVCAVAHGSSLEGALLYAAAVSESTCARRAVSESAWTSQEIGGTDIAICRNMASIVNLSDYRRTGKPAGAPAQDQPQYFCTRCDSADFKLYASGEVRCAHCHALIRNVAVAETRSS